MHSTNYAITRCLSVCLSHACIVSKRLNMSSNFFTVGYRHHSSFSTPNGMAIFQRGPPPNRGADCKGDMKKIHNFFQPISRFILEMIKDTTIVTVLWKANRKPCPSFQIVPFPMTHISRSRYYLTSNKLTMAKDKVIITRHYLMLDISETLLNTDIVTTKY